MAGTRPVPLIAGFVLALALLGVVAWFGWRQTARTQETAAWVAHTHEVQANRNLLLSLMLDIESNQRSYVLTGLPEFLDEFEKAVTRLPQQERRLEELTRDERQKAALSALKPLMAGRIAFARRTVELRQNSGAEAAAQEVATLKGKQLTDEILARFALMDARGDELLDERSAAARREAGTIVLLTLTGTALSFALLITVFALVLRENRRRLRAEAEVDRFFTLSLDMLCIASADGYFKRVSPAFTQTLGWSAKEMLARPFLDFVHPEDRAATLAEVERQVVAGEKVLQFENRYAHKDGSWRVLSWKSVPQPDGLMYATARDVTERRQAEEEIRKLNDELDQRVRERTAEFQESEQRYRGLVEVSPDAIFVNRENQIVFINAAGLKLLGATDPAQVLGRSPLDFFHPDGHPLIQERIRVLLENNQPAPLAENKLLRLDGAVVSVETTATSFEDRGVTSIQVVVRDITERKRAEAALHREQEFIEALLQNVALGVVACDANGTLVLFNQTAREWHGMNALALPPEEWARHYDLFEADGQTPLPTDSIPLLRAFRGEIIRDIGMAIVAKGQPPRFILASGTSFYDADGSALGAVAVMHDITEHKRAEEEIRTLNAELEQRVQERTRELADANKELESFSYSVSHDLRAPLRHVQGYVEMLERATDGQLSDQALRYLNTISAASVEMGQLIDDLLAFSRIGRIEMSESTVRLDAVVQDAIRGLEMATRSRNIVWQATPLPPVVGDPSLLKQVLINLIGNAVKYSGKRDPARIEIGCAGEDNGQVILFVRDNGAGFDMQYGHKLFGVFQRLHRAEEFEGTGIGLATVRRIIARHGGRVWAEGAVNQGATFYVTLKPSRTA